MNILTQKLPDSIIASGSPYPVNTDFRTWIKIEEILSGSPEQDELIQALILCYVDV